MDSLDQTQIFKSAMNKNKRNNNKFNNKNQLTNQDKREESSEGSMIINPFDNKRVVFFKDIAPSRVFTRMKFLCNRPLNAAGTNVASIQFNANGIFDFDPAVASNKVAGFDQWATFFKRYRVHGVECRTSFIVRDSNTPCVVNVGFETQTYTPNTKGQSNYDGSLQVSQLAVTNYPVKLRLKKTALQVVGDINVQTAQGYSGSTAANPVSLWYVSVAADCSQNTGATVFVNGVTCRMQFYIDVEWYERQNLSLDLIMNKPVVLSRRPSTGALSCLPYEK